MALSVNEIDAKYGTSTTYAQASGGTVADHGAQFDALGAKTGVTSDKFAQVSAHNGSNAPITPTPVPIDYALVSVGLLVVLICIAFVILVYVKRLNGVRHE